MSQEPSTVTYSLEEVLKRIEDKIDRQSEATATSIQTLENKLDDRINKLENKLNDKIDHVGNKLNDKIDKQSEEITTIRATLKAQQPLFEKIPDLTEKVGELKNWRQIVFIVVTATVSGLVGWLIRGGALKP